MDLQSVSRILALLFSTVGVFLVASGLGGIGGQRCAPVPDLNSSRPSRGLFEKDLVRPLRPASATCDDKVKLTLVSGYVLIDQFFAALPAGSGAGLPRQVRLRLTRYQYKTARYFRAQSTGLDNVIFANCLGIKAAFILGLIGMYTATFALLSLKQFVCYLNSEAVALEKIALISGAVAHLVGGILGIVWGLFGHLGKEEMAPATSLFCLGWLLGGIVFIFTGAVQVVDVVLSDKLGPRDTLPRDPSSWDRDGDAGPGGGRPWLSRKWASERQPPPGYDDDFYSRHQTKPSTTSLEEPELAPPPPPKKKTSRKRKGSASPAEGSRPTGTAAPIDARHQAARTATRVTNKANQASMPTETKH